MNQWTTRGMCTAVLLAAWTATAPAAQAAPVVGYFQNFQYQNQTTLLGWTCLQGGNTRLCRGAEPSGRLQPTPLIYMIVDPPGPKNGPAAGLLDGNVWVHDIYVAARVP